MVLHTQPLVLSLDFNVNQTTVTRFLYDNLYCLIVKTRKCIYWPYQKTILETLPKPFKKNYTNSPSIIAWTDIKTEQPNSVEQRLNMCSRYKNALIVTVFVTTTLNGLVCFLSVLCG